MPENNNPDLTFPTLETPRLVLRQILPTDAPALLRNYSDPEVTRWFQDSPLSTLREAEEIVAYFTERYRQGGAIHWGICLKREPGLIGVCGYVQYKPGGEGEIGYDLAKAWWGQGLMREAIPPVIAYGFVRLGLHRIFADTYRTNARSISLLDHLGFKLEQVKNGSGFHVLTRAGWRKEG